jgi:release factor glutamine methyltransferase
MRKLKQKIEAILLAGKNPKSVEAEARVLLSHVFKVPLSKLQTEFDSLPVTPDLEREALSLAEARAKGRPLQHILGVQFFYEHEYEVNASTLIPRPETEILVQAAIEWAKARFPTGDFRFAELGIGSGCISGELLSALVKARGVATEVEPLALALASRNLKRLGVEGRIQLHLVDPAGPFVGFDALTQDRPYDLVISNPPYVDAGDEIEAEVLQHEPRSALFAEPAPNFFYESFATHARALLAPHAAAFFEIPHERAGEIELIFKGAGLQTQIFLDLTGRPRVLKGNF